MSASVAYFVKSVTMLSREVQLGAVMLLEIGRLSRRSLIKHLWSEWTKRQLTQVKVRGVAELGPFRVAQYR